MEIKELVENALFSQLKQSCGIYAIYNKESGKIYIGSSKNINSRLKKHRYDLINKKNHNKYLQSAHTKYGESSFIYLVIEHTNIENLLERERFYLVNTDKDFQYNLTDADERVNHPSAETLKKLSESHKGIPQSEETRRRRSEAAMGHIVSSETRKKISETQKGKIIPEELRRRWSESRKGKPGHTKGRKFTEEHKQKLREAKLGKKLSQEHKQKIGQANSKKNIIAKSKA